MNARSNAQASPEHMPQPCSEMLRTNATYATNARHGTDTQISQVPDAPKPVETPNSARWVIRKKRFPWTGELMWRITHPSLPKYFDHSLHLDTFEDAVQYACAKERALAAG